jgi:uncharacterized protein YcgI (DUF1989 family)
MIREKRLISAQSGCGFVLKRGDLLKVTDPEGEQVADLFCFDLADPRDALSSGRSIDYNDTLRFTSGNKLYSFSGNVMLEITEDTCGTHDFLVTPCSRQMFEMLEPGCGYHPSCQENLAKAFAPFGIEEHRLGTTFNTFMNVPVGEGGRVGVRPPLSKPGDFIVFRAERDLIVALTACADEGTNHGRCKPIEFEIQRRET